MAVSEVVKTPAGAFPVGVDGDEGLGMVGGYQGNSGGTQARQKGWMSGASSGGGMLKACSGA